VVTANCDKTAKSPIIRQLSVDGLVNVSIMSRRTTFWEDLGIGVLAGATLVLAATTWVLLGA
jgi:hypothetical protein